LNGPLSKACAFSKIILIFAPLAGASESRRLDATKRLALGEW